MWGKEEVEEKGVKVNDDEHKKSPKSKAAVQKQAKKQASLSNDKASALFALLLPLTHCQFINFLLTVS